MSQKFLLREYYELDIDKSKNYLMESKVQDGNLYLVGIIQAADMKNGNGRIYPRQLLEREMNIYNKLIKDGRAVGELDHPALREEISLERISHIVESTWWDGNQVYGKIKVLTKMPLGAMLQSLIESGVKVGISSRAIGEVRETNEGLMVEELGLICFDIVHNPSTTNAFMLRESQMLFQNIPTITKSDMINRKIHKILDLK